MAAEKQLPIDKRPLILAAQAACVLEADAPKVGNVTRYHDFDDTTLEDFHISGLVSGPVLAETLERGVGGTVLEAVRQTHLFVRSNTNLGILLLLAPLAAAWLRMAEMPGPLPQNREAFLARWRQETGQVLQGLTREDAAAVYRAIRLVSPGGLGESSAYDVRDSDAPDITLREAMCLSAPRDMIGAEYQNNFQLVFCAGAPALERTKKVGFTLQQAIVQAHLGLLAAHGDSLILRKKGAAQAEEVRLRAQKAFELGGLATPEGAGAIKQLDEHLRRQGNSLNPGSTADLMAGALFVSLLADHNESAYP